MVPNADQALADLRELRELASAQYFDLFVFFRELTEHGTPILRAEVDSVATVGTDNHLVLYRISEPVQACLAALRMRNGNANEVVSGSGHDDLRRREVSG